MKSLTVILLCFVVFGCADTEGMLRDTLELKIQRLNYINAICKRESHDARLRFECDDRRSQVEDQYDAKVREINIYSSPFVAVGQLGSTISNSSRKQIRCNHTRTSTTCVED